MNIITHNINQTKIAEIISDEIIIHSPQDGLDLLGNLYYQDFDKIILHQSSLTPDFFDLKNRLAGEILQKFSTYRIRLAIIGDFSVFTSKSLNDFIYESNKGRQVAFVATVEEALERLSK